MSLTFLYLELVPFRYLLSVINPYVAWEYWLQVRSSIIDPSPRLLRAAILSKSHLLCRHPNTLTRRPD